ncbi:ubiquitin/ribosomal protein S27a fusion protein [Neoconidiobolus thromboides FSU 785]|nr:ubiquitin/ribosomal protein S27a fusion protein [Neoconidiobolus thromboides FSU 785]
MQISIQTLTGKSFAVEANSNATVAQLKAQVEACSGIPSEQQSLLFAQKSLDDELTLAHYNISTESTLHMVIDLLGGGKKRKKKNVEDLFKLGQVKKDTNQKSFYFSYTTPKKIKHKKKKVKLPVLKFYKVDADGKITRLRRECPNTDCGAGVFMAWHKDRQYCGRCGLTYVFNKEGEQA